MSEYKSKMLEDILRLISKEEMIMTENKMRKEIKITEAYGEETYQFLRELINEDGWCYYSEKDSVGWGAEVPNTHDYDVEFDSELKYLSKLKNKFRNKGKN